jgi:hypothetical protein
MSQLKDILSKEGMHPLSPGTVTHNATSVEVSQALFLAMEEGYVDAHYYPSNSHVGLEIVLWSKIAKQEDLRKAIMKALGSPLAVGKSGKIDNVNFYSSYRVIHGGMLGAKNWKEDVEAVGPVKKNLRKCDPEEKAAEPQIGEGPMPTEVFEAAVSSSLKMLPKKMDKVVAVLCGVEGKDECKIIQGLAKEKIDRVVALWACPEEGFIFKKSVDDVVAHEYICDSKDIKRSAKIEEGYSAVVVDPGASPEFITSMTEEFCKKNDSGQHVLLRDQVTFMTSLTNDAEMIFYASCVKNLIKNPVRSSRIIVDKTPQYGLIGTSNPGFVQRVVKIQEAIEKKTGRRTLIEKMVAGPVRQQDKYDPNHYPPNAYDERDALKQYTNQIPLATQSLYQLEVSEEDAKKLSATLIKDALDSVIKVNNFQGAKRVDYAEEIGDGSVSAAIMAAAHIIVTWDGAGRLTLNTMTLGEQYEPVPPNAEVPDMVLSAHKNKIVEPFIMKLPASTKVSVREQMPRGSNRVANFKKDINAVPDCADHYDICFDFAKDGECDDEEEMPWMQKYCSLSCGTCDKMTMGVPSGFLGIDVDSVNV